MKAIDNRPQTREANAEDLENLDAEIETPNENTDTEEEEIEETKTKPQAKEEIEDTEEEEEVPDEEEETEEAPTKKKVYDPHDYKERYDNSTREAMLLAAKNKKLTETINQAAELPEPTEEQLRAYVQSEGSNWDDLDNFQRSLAKKTLYTEQKFSMVHEAALEGRKTGEWMDNVDQFLEQNDRKQTYPQVVGREDEFRQFCLKPSRRGLDMEDLVSAFSYKLKPVAKRPSSLLQTGNGGELPRKNTVIDDIDKVTLYRTSDPRKYRALIKAKKLRVEI